MLTPNLPRTSEELTLWAMENSMNPDIYLLREFARLYDIDEMEQPNRDNRMYLLGQELQTWINELLHSDLAHTVSRSSQFSFALYYHDNCSQTSHPYYRVAVAGVRIF